MKVEIRINELNNILNKDDKKKRENFLHYYNFISKKDILDYYENFINTYIEFFNEFNKKQKFYIIGMMSIRLCNNSEQISFFVLSIIFKNLIKNNIMDYDKNSDVLEPYYINSDKFLNKCTLESLGFFVYYDMNYISINNDELTKELDSYFFKAINFLINSENSFISTKKIEVIKNNNVKTPIFFGLNEKFWFLDYADYCDINFNKYNIKEFKGLSYLVGYNFSKCSILFKKNPRSGSYFILNDNKTLNKLINQKIYLDVQSLEIIVKKIEDKTGVKWDELEFDIKKLYTSLSSDSFGYKHKREIMREISKKIIYFNVIILKKLGINEKTPFYFRFSFDFRGRIYYESKIGVTYSKLNRFVYFFGYINKCDINIPEIDITEERINSNKEDLIKILEKYKIKINKVNLNIAYWVSISIGKNFIDKSINGIKDAIFIQKCLEYLNSVDKKDIDFETQIELNHLKIIIQELNNDIIKLRPISKDATASVIQNYMRILGPKDDNSLIISNINGEHYWYDPYSFIIEKFKDKFEKNYILEKYFKRKFLKKIIMTIPYQSTLYTCQNYFLEEIEKEYKDFDKKDFFKKDDIKKEETLQINLFIKKFYEFLKSEVENKYLYEIGSQEIMNTLDNILGKNGNENNDFKMLLVIVNDKANLNVYDYNNSYSNLIYFKLTTKYMDFVIKTNNGKNIRKTKEYKKMDECVIDYAKLKSSFKANYLHFHDAEFIRLVIDKMFITDMLFIHDSILLSFLDINKLITVTNSIFFSEKIKKYYKNKKKRPFSFFILL